MGTRKVTIAVDEQFFKNIFEKQRKQLQTKLGLVNLSQGNFSKMIKGLKIRTPKPISKPIKRRGRQKRDEFIMF